MGHKTYALLILSFLFGWASCGYYVYGKMYSQAYDSPQLRDLADTLNKKGR